MWLTLRMTDYQESPVYCVQSELHSRLAGYCWCLNAGRWIGKDVQLLEINPFWQDQFVIRELEKEVFKKGPFKKNMCLLRHNVWADGPICLTTGPWEGLKTRGGGTVFWMGFYADISWESRCSNEIKVWGHLCQILVVFKIPAQPRVKGMSGNSWNYQNLTIVTQI